MRLRDLRGENELRGARSLMCCLIVANEAGWNMLTSSRRVMSSVFEGGCGCESGGIVPRSIESGECARLLDSDFGEEDAEIGGEFDTSRTEGECSPAISNELLGIGLDRR